MGIERLRGPAPLDIDPAPELWGFGGLHGGLTLALMLRATLSDGGERRVRSVTGQFLRSVREPAVIEVDPAGAGRTLSTVTARMRTAKGVTTTMTAVLSAPTSAPDPAPPITVPAPDAPPPEACEVFTIPPEFVPFARHTEIRPVGTARPYTAGPTAELTAWIRLVDDDEPPDDARLVVLLDSLAPSYAAVLSALAPIPTIELSVRPTPALDRAESPWVLVRARTNVAGESGWIDESLDAWGPDGAHLAHGSQLRLLAAR